MKKFLSLVLIVILVFSFTLPAAAISSKVTVKSISLESNKITLEVGKTYNLKVTFYPSNTSNKLLTYVTQNKLIASIDKYGKVLGVKPGATSIIVSSSNKNVITTLDVTVVPKQITKLKAFLMYADADRKALHDTFYTKNVKKELPDFNVQFEVTAGTGYLDKLRVYNSSGDMPDVYWGNALPIVSGNSLDLTNIIKQDGFIKKFTNPNVLIPWKNGKIYAISSGSDTNFIPVVFYNKAIFAKSGLTVPKTIDEFISAGKKLKVDGYIPLSAPGAWVLCETFMQDLFTGIDPKYPSKILAGTAKFSDPTGIKAFKELKGMIDAGMFPTNMSTIDYGGGIQLFTDKKAAMCFVPTWEVGGMEKASPDFDFFGMPGAGSVDINKNINIWGSAQNGFSVFTHSKNKDAAVKLAEWLVSQDAKYFQTVKGQKVSYDIGIPLKDISPLTQKTYDRIAGATVTQTAVMTLSGPTDAIFQTNMGKFLTGQITAEDFTKLLDDAFAKNDLNQ